MEYFAETDRGLQEFGCAVQAFDFAKPKVVNYTVRKDFAKPEVANYNVRKYFAKPKVVNYTVRKDLADFADCD